jgi:hypothetical protein
VTCTLLELLRLLRSVLCRTSCGASLSHIVICFLCSGFHLYAQADLDLTQYGQSGDQWTFTREGVDRHGFSVNLTQRNPRSYSVNLIGDLTLDSAEPIVQRALEAVRQQDMGESTWYGSGFRVDTPDLFASSLHMVRTMGDAHPISGWFRLSNDVLLNFRPNLEVQASSFMLPPMEIGVFIKVPGGGHGPFSNRVASEALEFVRLICSFSLGRPVAGPPGVIFPTDQAGEVEANARQCDFTGVLPLGGNGVPFDPFVYLATLGGPESVVRYRGSLVAYDLQSNRRILTSQHSSLYRASKPCCHPRPSGEKIA